MDLYSDGLEKQCPQECKAIRADERRKVIAEFKDAFYKTFKLLQEDPCDTCKHTGKDPLKAPCVYCMYSKNSMWEAVDPNAVYSEKVEVSFEYIDNPASPHYKQVRFESGDGRVEYIDILSEANNEKMR